MPFHNKGKKNGRIGNWTQHLSQVVLRMLSERDKPTTPYALELTPYILSKLLTVCRFLSLPPCNWLWRHGGLNCWAPAMLRHSRRRRQADCSANNCVDDDNAENAGRCKRVGSLQSLKKKKGRLMITTRPWIVQCVRISISWSLTKERKMSHHKRIDMKR